MGWIRIAACTAGVLWSHAARAAEPVPVQATTTTPSTTTAPSTTAPSTTAPSTTAPSTTAPVTTAPVTTAPVTTAPVTTAPSLAQRSAVDGNATEQRARVLARYIEPELRLHALEPYWGAASATLCAAGATAAALDDREQYDSRPYLIGVLGTCSVLSLASYAMPRDYRGDVVALAFFGGLGGTLLVGMNASAHSTASRITLSAFGGSFIAYGGLRLLDAGLRRPVAGSTLIGHARALASGEDSVSSAELARMELDFRRAHQRPIPRWAFGAAPMLAGVVAMSPAWVASTSARDRFSAYGFGALLIAQGALGVTVALTVPSRYDRYVEALRALELSPLGPEGSFGLSLSGQL